ncbi:MFS transporter [Mitsuokella sp.]|uniref:MFS transporter n=1 Tax=Mitsuokella sp. TaxID=2049034 RepID=UPI002A81B248|nr:MFS transporter [Mitsuokella sp.]MDY4474648.1 MFS transporter [Mitsuokella sp.]
MNKKYLYLLAAAHLSNDINTGSLPALLPFFVSFYGMDYTAIAGLMFASSFLSSIIQPLFGWLADKGSRQWFMAVGVFFAGTSLALTGFVTDYWLIFAAVTIMGIASSIFHPEAARCVNGVSQGARGKGMSIFSVGGNGGFGFGPLLAVFLVTTFGMHGLAFYGITAVAMSILLLLAMPHLRRAIAANKKMAKENIIPGEKGANLPAANDWHAFGRLFVVILFRSTVFTGLSSFLPLFCIQALGTSEAIGSMTLSIISIAGVVATLFGGWFADRHGYRKTLRLGSVLLVPFLAIAVFSGSIYAVYAMLLPMSFAMLAPYSSFVVIGQEYLAKNIGFASGVTLGISMSIGGIIAPALGRYADLHGIAAVMALLVLLATICAAATFLLPAKKSNA